MSLSPLLTKKLKNPPAYRQFGKVFKGMKKDTGEIVAIKALPLDPEADDSTFRTIAKEIQMLKDCDHPNIVSFFGSYVKENELWVRTEASPALLLSLSF